ncbi:MAG: DUF4397 domain-containing protein [bacterium]|nr:DUF4397 domain-containing protein [Gammaproteobacteria bacterium]HIL98980.1 DUF4397 domain-containing protein [Pseudomonadales bacterium]
MRRLYSTVLLLCSLFLISSCGDDPGFTPPIPVPTAFATVVNVVPDSPQLAVFGNDIFVDQIQYAQSSDVIRALPLVALDYRVVYFTDNVETTVLESVVFIDIDHLQTIITTGSIDAAVPIVVDSVPLEFEEGNTNSYIVFVNATSSVGVATVTLTNSQDPTQTIPVPNGQQTERITVTSGSDHNIVVTDASNGNQLWQSGDFGLSAQTERIFVLVDYFGPGTNTVRMMAVSVPGQFPNEQLDTAVRFSNMIPDHGPVDISVADVVVASNLVFQESTNFLPVSAGSSTVKVYTSGDPSDELFSGESTLIPGFFYDQGFAGLGGVAANSLSFSNQRPAAPRGRIHFTKLAPTKGIVDIYIHEPGIDISTIAPVARLAETESTTLEILSGTFNLVVTDTATTNVVYGPVRLDIENRGVYSVILTDKSGGGEPMEAVFLDDFN